MTDSKCSHLPELENNAKNNNDASQSDLSTSIIHLDKDELLNKL